MILSLIVSQMEKETDEIETADPYQHIHDSGKPGHIAEQKCHEVETEKTDQAPVHGTDDGYGECGSIQIFITHKISLSCLCEIRKTGLTQTFFEVSINNCFEDSICRSYEKYTFFKQKIFILIYFNVIKHQIGK